MNIPALLRKYDLRPEKRLGQNFLVDESALQNIVDLAAIPPDEAVLEIGPGLGSLTRHLALSAKRVVAVELDHRLIPVLGDTLSTFRNVSIVEGDILALDPSALMEGMDYLVVANIPYYITSALIRHLLEARRTPQRLVLTVQEEVARRMCAAPGEMSLLALSVQIYGRPQLVARIPSGAFFPPPRVDSAVVRIDVLPDPPLSPARRERLFRLAKAGFSQKRKTLRNSLAGGMHWQPAQAGEILVKAGIDPMRRPETLSLEEWIQLTAIEEAVSPA